MAAPTVAAAPEEITTALPYDLEVNDDADSALGSTDDESISTSVRSSIFEYRQENGRTYHNRDAQYEYPNDEIEQDRLDRMHYLFQLIFDGKNFLAPVGKCENVLDIGTGTGIWAIDFADAHPEADVLGTELSPIQPPFLPPNVSTIIDDANEDWNYPKKFDYIHSRQLHSAVEEKKLFRQAFDHLVPGGWYESTEVVIPISCDDGTLDPKSSLAKYSDYVYDATRRIGQPFDNSLKYAQWMRDAGFVDVHEVMYKLPINPWVKGKKEQEIGWWMLDNLLDTVSMLSLPLFTRVLDWSPEEVQVFSAHVRKDYKNTAIHAYYRVMVTYGRKPESA